MPNTNNVVPLVEITEEKENAMRELAEDIIKSIEDNVFIAHYWGTFDAKYLNHSTFFRKEFLPHLTKMGYSINVTVIDKKAEKAGMPNAEITIEKIETPIIFGC